MAFLLTSLFILNVELAPNPALALGWYDGFQLCRAMKSAVQEEVAQIFAGIGVRVHWEDEPGARPTNGAETPVNVVLVRQHPSTWGLKPSTLGVVIGRRDPRTAYAFVSRAFRVVGHMAEKPNNCPGPKARHQVSRALGRVIAHEIFHTIAPDHPHAEDGLMHGHMDRNRLLARFIGLDAECSKAFLLALQQLRHPSLS